MYSGALILNLIANEWKNTSTNSKMKLWNAFEPKPMKKCVFAETDIRDVVAILLRNHCDMAFLKKIWDLLQTLIILLGIYVHFDAIGKLLKNAMTVISGIYL